MTQPPTLTTRASGVLLHPTSLPGPYGVGDLGPEARVFVDFLAEGAQRWWQMLPVVPIGPGYSPYASPSAFAGNPQILSLEEIVSTGLLAKRDIRPPRGLTGSRAKFDAAWAFKEPLLRRAFERFEGDSGSRDRKSFDEFRGAAEAWLPDYALFEALKTLHGGRPWNEWERSLRLREPGALSRAREAHSGEVRFHEFLQFLFDRQWRALRARANGKGVGLIGDIPIFVARDSADVWANTSVFELDAEGMPLRVAGVPPDYFSATGQLWGNPLYRWEVLRRRGYVWWVLRLRATYARFDAVRIDHFIGFSRFYAIPAGEKTAVNGKYEPGPGADFFEKVLSALGPVSLIAEDLGSVTPEVKALRDQFGFPGMRVLQFAFSPDGESPSYLPHNHVKRAVVYTGTHDNDTTAGWFRTRNHAPTKAAREAAKREREFCLRYAASDGKEIHWDLIRLAMGSVADTAVFPMQDLLGLGTDARMNLPGSPAGNWSWRLIAGQASPRVAKRLAELTRTYGRA